MAAHVAQAQPDDLLTLPRLLAQGGFGGVLDAGAFGEALGKLDPRAFSRTQLAQLQRGALLLHADSLARQGGTMRDVSGRPLHAAAAIASSSFAPDQWETMGSDRPLSVPGVA